jgi:hypothetical protein
MDVSSNRFGTPVRIGVCLVAQSGLTYDELLQKRFEVTTINPEGS